jgi:hypothetical protein
LPSEQSVLIILPLTRFYVSLLIVASFQIAGQLYDDFRWMPVSQDDCVYHAAQLIEADVHSRVCQFAETLFDVLFVRIARSGDYVTLKNFAVVRE